MKQKLLFFLISLISLSLIPQKLNAKTANDLAYWHYFDTTFKLDKISPDLYFRQIISPRMKNEFQEMDIVRLRSSIGYHWNDSIRTDLGYDWTRVFNNDFNYENRFWQELYLRKKLNSHRFYTRLRLEERLLNDDFILRLRTRLGYMYQITDTISMNISDEMFFNLNTAHGLEANRILLTLNKDINHNLTLSLGYQLQHNYMDRNLISHAIVTRIRLFF